ncbi:MAG TPA: alpha/beta hydrolase, partial [Ramlibacter sp.]|nr:alpha/beta hydrolase [Ramlibacter sp.]
MQGSDLMRRRLLGAAGASLLLPGCSALGALDALVPRDSYEGRPGLAYGDLPRQKLDAYLPLQRSAATPLVVFFYGGTWTTGNRGDYRFVGEALASQGIGLLVADYRLSPAVRWNDIVDDCARAAAWGRDNAARLGCSREHLFLMGHSAGAYNAAMLALDARWLQRHGMQPRELAGWIGIAGPYDFLPISDAASRLAFDWPNTPADSQPIVHVSPGDPRALLLA